MIDHDQAVAVAVERDAGVGAHPGHGELQQARLGRTATVIDVAPVGRTSNWHDLRA